jgi:hypothetical protein
MSEQVKMGLIIGGAIIVAAAIWIYFSPFQTCLRENGGYLMLCRDYK